ncbi:MAG: hypothetical protein ABL917_00605, partial [Parcubacteria group bacterium]
DRRKQVPESDPVYQEVIKKRKKYSVGSDVAFFKEVSFYNEDISHLESLQRNRKNIDDYFEKYGKVGSPESLLSSSDRNLKLIEETTYVLEKDKKSLINSFEEVFYKIALFLNKHENLDKELESDIRKMFEVMDDGEKFEDFFQEGLNFDSVQNFCKKIEQGHLSFEKIHKLAEKHMEEIDKQMLQIMELAKETKEEMVSLVKEAVERGELPQDVLVSLPRLENVTVGILDRLSHVSSRTLGSMGHDGTMKINNERLKPEYISSLKKTMIHEFFHELSGKSITTSTFKGQDGSEKNDMYLRKTGVSLYSPGVNRRPNLWLNEAITEWLALRVSKFEDNTNAFSYKGSTSYVYERMELDSLFDAGLEEKVVTDAYFENFSTDTSEKSGSKYARLIQRINEIEGPLGLGRIENKHIFGHVVEELVQSGLYPTKEVKEDFLHIAQKNDGSKIFNFYVEVGANSNVSTSDDFSAIVKPFKNGDKIVTVEETLKIINKELDLLKKKYPHLKIELKN